MRIQLQPINRQIDVGRYIAQFHSGLFIGRRRANLLKEPNFGGVEAGLNVQSPSDLGAASQSGASTAES
jgi:hypothetical protein